MFIQKQQWINKLVKSYKYQWNKKKKELLRFFASWQTCIFNIFFSAIMTELLTNVNFILPNVQKVTEVSPKNKA